MMPGTGPSIPTVRPDVHAAGGDDLAVPAGDVLVPAGAFDELREPRPGLEPVDTLEEIAPLVAGVSVNPLDHEPACREFGRRLAATNHAILSQLYGVAAVDPAAQDLVDRQRRDRRGEIQRLARRLRRSGRLRKGLGEASALALLMLLTSYESFRELREAGLSEPELTRRLQESARELLLG
jgi:hypothetical protein